MNNKIYKPDTNTSLMVVHLHILYQVAAFAPMARPLRHGWNSLVGISIKEDTPKW